MQVEPQITFKGIETSPAMEALIRERIDALERFHPRVTSCRVVVDAPHRGSETVKVPLSVTVEVELPGRNTVVGKDEEDRHEAREDHTVPMNKAFDAVERQLKKIADIQHGEVQNAEASPQQGMIVRLFPRQSHGFVQIDGSPELYFTRNAVIGDFDELREGMLVQVTRATEEGPMGPQASSVRLLERSSTPPA